MSKSCSYLRPYFDGSRWIPTIPPKKPALKTSEDEKSTTVFERSIEEKLGPINELHHKDVLGMVFSDYLDMTSLFFASRVSLLWKEKIQCVLWERKQPFREGLKVNLDCLVESFDQLHFPETYKKEEEAKYSAAKEEFKELIQGLNTVPKTIREILFCAKFPALKIKEILEHFPKILPILDYNISRSLQKKRFNEKDYAEMEKINTRSLDFIYKDPKLFVLAEQRSPSFAEELGKQFRPTLNEEQLTFLDSPEVLETFNLIYQEMSSWDAIRQIIAGFNRYQTCLELVPTEEYQVEMILATLDTLIDLWAFQEAESLVYHFTSDPQYYPDSVSSDSLEEDEFVVGFVAPRLIKKWTKALPKIVRSLILSGDPENAFRLTNCLKRVTRQISETEKIAEFAQIPELMFLQLKFQLIEEIGKTYIDLGEEIHVQSILALLSEESDEQARKTQCELINYQGFKLAKEGKLEEARDCCNRYLNLLHSLWLEYDDSFYFFDDLLKNHSGILILLSKVGYLGKAQEFIKDALDVFLRNQTQEDFVRQFFHLNIFALLCKMGDFDNANRQFDLAPDSTRHHYRKKHNASLLKVLKNFTGDLIQAGAVDGASLQKYWRVIDLLIGNSAKRKALINIQETLQKASESIDPEHRETYDHALQQIQDRLASLA